MAKPVGDGKEPVASGSPSLYSAIHQTVSWLGRSFKFIVGNLTENAKKVENQSIVIQSKSKFTEPESLQQKFRANMDFILKLGKEDFDLLKVENGKLVKTEEVTTRQDKEAARVLIQQTYRQAWGKLIDAQFGYTVKPEALKNLNQLKDHLVKNFPEGIPHEEPEKLLSLLIERYHNQPLPLELESIRTRQRDETAGKAASLADAKLHYKPLGGAEKGMNPTEFVRERTTGEKLAIAKSANEQGLSEEVAEQQRVENPSIFEFLGGFQELAVSYLNILLQGRLGIPLAKEEGSKTIHAFVENVGNFHDYVEARGKEALQDLPLETSQHFVFAELITRNEDCHGENILFSPSGDPIPIDFGRILNHERAIRACYLDFSCLDLPVNPEDQAFYKGLDVEKTMDKLTLLLKNQYPVQFSDPVTLKAITIKLNLLKARLYMIKEGINAGLNQRQMVALDLPPLTAELESMHDRFKSEEGWPFEEETPTDLFGGPAQDWFGGYLARKGFQAAWNGSFDEKTGAFDTDQFLELLRPEIQEIQSKPTSTLYTAREKKLYTTANYDWTTLPRLDLSE